MNYPSLSELLAAYKNDGVANGINQAAQNYVQGATLANTTSNNAANQAAKQTELGIQQQNADTTAAGEKARFIPAEMAERVTGSAPGTFGAPGSLIPTTAIDAYNQRKGHEADVQAQIAGQANLKNLTLAQQQMEAQLKAQEEAHRTAEQANANRVTTGTALLKDANDHQPGFFMSAADKAYNALTGVVGNGQHLPSVQNNMDQRQLGMNALGGVPANPTQVAPVDTSTGPYGASVNRNGKTYVWSPSTKMYHLAQ